MKPILLFAVFFLMKFGGFSVKGQDVEYCAACSMEAWEGDSVALDKFIRNCGVIDTMAFDSLNKPVEAKPVYETITMKLNSGKVLYKDSVYFVVNKLPEFPGGELALFNYVRRNINYPEIAKQRNISGTVYIDFVVDKTGEIKSVKVKRGVGGGCDAEAVRLMRSMPLWTPGIYKNKSVSVHMVLPVKFALR